ncbi:hypothetical protein [Flavivirga eckloniae]|uniref:Uncharacterized protein n=1 Tax=Flavivirga eckloniae TaxID=1803846 RepID=A0A2K9PTD5_9FLAO|nr:hypothetical protein [Flavivirga eckloniae]AUP80322.1 hypothetical protein C1H87_17045 [Flavivirga eckloniae]
MIEVLVYKTNVDSKKSATYLKPFLDDLLTGSKWNFDLEDCDKVLRVENDGSISKKIIALLKEKGFLCEELEN